MKTTGYIVIAMLAMVGCNNSEEVQKFKTTVYKDSALLVQSVQKDSEISAYLQEMSEIASNLDRIKTREKIITLKSGGNESMSKDSLMSSISDLDSWIVMNDKKMNRLQAKLKTMTTKNDNLSNLVSHLMDEVAEKDEDIADLQDRLSKADAELIHIAARFDDSIMVIKKERALVSTQKAELNTVYYVIGTLKQLQDKGVVDKEGGFIGIGRVAVVNPQIDNSNLTKADLTVLKGINLNGKFRRFITVHPENSYVLISSSKSDSISITVPAVFWRESKYLVVATK